MAETSYPFSTAAVNEDEWALIAPLWSPDGLSEDSPDVTLGSGLSFTVPADVVAWVRGFAYHNDSTLTKTAPDNLNSSPRLDQLVLRLDRASNVITAAIVQGTPAATPVLPALTQTSTTWEIPIAYATCPGSASAQNYSGLTLNYPRAGTPDYGAAVKKIATPQDTLGSTSSTSYVSTLSGSGSPVGCSTTFVAPPSGEVEVQNTGNCENSGTNSACMSFEIREGSVIGSGTPFQSAIDGNANTTSDGSGARTTVITQITGLTPGKVYNIRQMFRSSSGSALFSLRRLVVKPERG